MIYSVEVIELFSLKDQIKNYLKVLVMSLTSQYVPNRNGFQKCKFKSSVIKELLFDMEYKHSHKSPLLPKQWDSSFLPYMVALDGDCQCIVLCPSKRQFSAKG